MLKNVVSRVMKFPLNSRIPRFYNHQNDNQHISKEENLTFEQIKTNQAIAKNVGMNQFLMRVYNTTGISILGALGSSFMFMSMPFVSANLMMSSLIGAVMGFGGLIATSYMKPKNIVENVNGIEIFKTINTPMRLGLYGMGIVGLGLSASPLFMMAQAINPSILPTAFGISASIFGGVSMLAYKMPKDKMLGYGGVLGGSLLGLIGLQLVGLLSTLFVGPNAFSSLLFRMDNYIGIALFSAFIAYDTHMAIKMYEMREADHLGLSVQFLLNFWNILVRLVSILMRRE